MVDMKLGVSQSSQLELSISVIPFFKISLLIIGDKGDFVKKFLWRPAPIASIDKMNEISMKEVKKSLQKIHLHTSGGFYLTFR